MLAEGIIAITVLAIVLSLFFGVAVWTRNTAFERFYELRDRCNANQLKLLVERDFFIRRRSPVKCAHRCDERFCLGFWEESDDELKYIIYDVRVTPDSDSHEAIFFRRYCMNQNTLNGELKGYCRNIITAISNGTYVSPTRVYYNDFTELFEGTVYTDGEVLNFNYGDFEYAFPL
ncbi:MAG TPA: hypothetical protein PLO84_10735 [Thermotogota bacterium]|nr:hypothetical protein [Thermotogota bacterium]